MRQRLPRPTLTGLVAICCLGFAVPSASGESQEAVDYRRAEWKRVHYHDAEKADQLVSALKKLGCEVERDSHDGDIDVAYRCPKWRRMNFKTHADAHRWEEWLKAAGFETRHEH